MSRLDTDINWTLRRTDTKYSVSTGEGWPPRPCRVRSPTQHQRAKKSSLCVVGSLWLPGSWVNRCLGNWGPRGSRAGSGLTGFVFRDLKAGGAGTWKLSPRLFQVGFPSAPLETLPRLSLWEIRTGLNVEYGFWESAVSCQCAFISCHLVHFV